MRYLRPSIILTIDRLGSINADPDNLAAVNTLAGMGVLTDDDNLVDAALSEILALPLDQRQLRDPERDVTYLLTQHYLGQVRLSCQLPPLHAHDHD